MFLGGVRANGDHHDFAGDALFLETHRFFHGDLAERVHRHLDVGQLDAGVVRLDANLDVVVDHSFDSYQNLHGFLVFSGELIWYRQGVPGRAARRVEPTLSYTATSKNIVC
ncbi:hypothetical protein D3C81_1386290 [compost metagenome]